MALIFIFFLLLITLFFLAIKKNQMVFLGLCLNIFIFLSIGSGFIPDILLQGLQIHPYLANPNWKERNVIVLLAGGAVKWPDSDRFKTQNLSYSRIHEAARLYFLCKKNLSRCFILISGGDPAQHGISEALIMRNDLLDIGADPAEIITETKSLNTYQNAHFSSEIIRAGAFDRVLIVTSGTHLSRALMLFSHFGIEAAPSPADHLAVSRNWKNLYTNFFITDLALHEYVGQLKFLISK